LFFYKLELTNAINLMDLEQAKAKLMKKLVFLILLLISLHNKILAQDIEPIEPDRPDQTESPIIIPVKYFQMENGFAYLYNDKQNKAYTYPSTLMKYGIAKFIDLRVITGLVTTRSGNENATGIVPLTIGFKLNFLKEKGVIPQTAFLAHLSFPTLASAKYKATYYAPSFKFAMQHTLSKKVSLGYNLGALWNGALTTPIFLYTLTAGVSLTEKLGSFIEVYGFAPKHEAAQHNIDAGLSFLVNNNISLDISGGYRLTPNAPEYFVAFGFSFRVNTKKSK
jgi:hypothetical protein